MIGKYLAAGRGNPFFFAIFTRTKDFVYNMKTSELIAALQQEMQQKGDKDIIIAANRHSYYNAKIVSNETITTLALFDKVAD